MWTQLEPAATTVDPGSAATVRLRLRNTGDTVEEYRLTLVGEAAGWAHIEPAALRVYPGAEESAQITFAPPRTSDATAGPVPFGVRVEPRERPHTADVAEGRLTVGPFTAVKAELVPRTVRGRFRARGAVAVDNLGNQPLTATFSGRDNGDSVGVEATPGAVQVEPGRAGFAELNIRPGRVSWIGGSTEHPYTVKVLRAGSQEPEELRGSYVQPSVVPGWALAVCSALVVLAVAAAALWFKHDPKVTSSATVKKTAASALPNPQGSASAAPPPPKSAPPPEPKTDNDPPPEGEAKAPPKEEKKDGGGGGGAPKEKKKSPYDPLKKMWIQSGLSEKYLGASKEHARNGRNTYTLGWIDNQTPWDQYWYVHPLPDGNYAFTSSDLPIALLDNTREGDQVQLWESVKGTEPIAKGGMRDNQKWRINPIGDGWVRIISLEDGNCLTDMSPNSSQYLQVTEVKPCESVSRDQQKWKIVESKDQG
ncbi:RICIN domain-containing protein [Streptomyces sp. NPDC050504]|uniref:RICIN domain-containing protein n=1 Tax=Streptomyces sp. NPDC050504 TaxID=3365618 RepID=UPI00379A56CB